MPQLHRRTDHADAGTPRRHPAAAGIQPSLDVVTATRSARRRGQALSGALLAATPVVLVLAVGAGAVPISPADVAATVWMRMTGGPLTVPPAMDQIVWAVRLPRVLLAFVVGAALGVAGAVLQAVVRNPLAEPYVLGVSAGASLAAVGVITSVGLGTGVLAATGVSGAAFVGALATLIAVVALGRRAGRLDPVRLLLAGVALSYLLQAATSWLQLRSAPNQLAAVLFWLLGTLSGADWGDLALPAAVMVVVIGWLMLQARPLNALLAGDDVAASLGVSADQLRLRLLVAVAALTAVVISVAGGVGFVGLIAPHCVRLLIGPEHRRLLPATAVLGGLFLVVADLCGRVLAAPLELPLNVITAIAGVPLFLVLLRRSGRPGAEG